MFSKKTDKKSKKTFFTFVQYCELHEYYFLVRSITTLLKMNKIYVHNWFFSSSRNKSIN